MSLSDSTADKTEQRRALIIVDVQPTFCEGGELAVAGGNAVAERIAKYVRSHHCDYQFIVTTQDWHIDPGSHFSEHPDYVDTWPPHGQAGSENAQLHPEIAALLAAGLINAAVKKGQYAAAYSGFEGKDSRGRGLEQLLREQRITHLDVVGIAQSHCVCETALDGREHGFAVTVIADLTVPVSAETEAVAWKRMEAAGVERS